jgi:hypothetical protein
MDETPHSGGKEASRDAPVKQAVEPHRKNGRGFVHYVKRIVHKRRAKRENEKPEERAARLTATATVWIAIFTIVLAIVAGLTLVELILSGADTKALVGAAAKQATAADKTKDSAEKSAQASRDFADTAGDINGSINDAVKKLDAQAKAIEVTRAQSQKASDASLQADIDNFQVDQRAWVSVTSAIEGVFDPDKAIEVPFRMHNLGRTPARHAVLNIAIGRFARSQKPPDPLRWDKSAPLGDIQPDSILTDNLQLSPLGIPIGQPLYDHLLNGDGFIVVRGKLTYDDAFKFSHWTDFCWVFSPRTKTLDMCIEHNEVDNENR